MSNLQHEATKARKAVLKMIYDAQSSHIGSNFSCIDILTCLFDKIDLKKDKFICSKGWIAASVYYFLAERAIIPKEDLERYCKEGEETYIGLIEPQGKFGLECAGGAVGYGLSFGVGMALAKKMKGEEGTVYVLMSDGELNTGMVWESALVAAHHKLDNLVAIIDRNGFQATGKTEDILKSYFPDNGWNRRPAIDGHHYDEIEYVISRVQQLNKQRPVYVWPEDWCNEEKPTVLICNTIKGKGVKEFEGKLEWHYRNIPEDIYKQAVEELTI